MIGPGKTAFVTGGGGGIGLAIGQVCGEAGMTVILADANGERLEGAVADFPFPAASVRMDVADQDAWEAARVRFGPVDLLINAAAVAPSLTPLVDMPVDEFERILRINLNSVFYGIRTFGPGMRDRRSGHIVNISSQAGLLPMPRLGGYGTAKFGVVGLSDILRAELEEFGVGVTVVMPGLVRSNMTVGMGMEPVWVARAVAEAVRVNAPYVITHPNCREAIEQRHGRLMAHIGDWAQPGYDEAMWERPRP